MEYHVATAGEVDGTNNMLVTLVLKETIEQGVLVVIVRKTHIAY